ncbi:MAG TPA: glycosyltransferase [Polyangiaceae bacterium]|nr:glycosyltransferase [Polyangiaceae bacterium]
MSAPPRLVVLGLSITSSWGNGHATTYRGLVRGMSRIGYRTLFLERNMPWYEQNRDASNPVGCEVALYESLAELERLHAEEIRRADAVIVGSYVPEGVEVARFVSATARCPTFFYDIDTPVTLARLAAGDTEYLAAEAIPRFDAYLSFTGGPTLDFIERELGARRALPLFCSADPDSLAPAQGMPARELGYLGTYSDDRQPGVNELLVEPALRLPEKRFVVGGPCYPKEISWPPNVERIEHVAPGEHARFYGSQRYTLNVTRADMKRLGYSPSVRLFEAAACAAPIITDRWQGIEEFFEPGREILLASTANEVMSFLEEIPEHERRAIGARARRRFLKEHTGQRRAAQLDGYIRAARSAATRITARVSTFKSHESVAIPENPGDA